MSTAQKYRKKPVVIEAMQWDGTASGATVIIDWILNAGATANFTCLNPGPCQADSPHAISIKTLEGPITASAGDYVIKGVQGEFYPCKPDIFAATYDVVGRRVVPTTAEDFPSSMTPSGIAIGWFGEDGQWAVAFGHVPRIPFADAIDEFQGNGENDAVDLDDVQHLWAVMETDDSLAEDDDLHTIIRWTDVSEQTEHAFPVTVLDTEA